MRRLKALMKCLKDLRIKFINFGIACRINNNIYFNKALTRYPHLLARILAHEIKHSSRFTLHDIYMDCGNEELKGFKFQFYKFLFSTPSAWIELLPVWVYEGRTVINPTVGLFWIIITALLGALYVLV